MMAIISGGVKIHSCNPLVAKIPVTTMKSVAKE
jgi:hypothetical protein